MEFDSPIIYHNSSLLHFSVSQNLLGPSANVLKEEGTYIISVGLGNDTSFDELKKISNSREAVYVLKDYAEIATYVETLARGICEGREL